MRSIVLLLAAAISACSPTPEDLARRTVIVAAHDMIGGSIGTGVIVGDGLVLTARHVVKGASVVAVVFYEGDVIAAEVVAGGDPGVDAVVLKVEVPEEYDVAEVSCRQTERGEPLTSVHHSSPMRWAFSAGYMSTVMTSAGDEERDVMLQMNAARGASGAPVFDAFGKVVGIITGWLTQPAATQTDGPVYVPIGYAFMVPSTLICAAWPEMLP